MPHKLTNLPLIKRIHKSWHSKSASGSIFRNMAVLASGSMVARAITIASMPIITRIYLPEHMGVLSVFMALTALITPFETMRYTSAIPLPKRDGIALNIAALCALILFSVTGLITIAFALTASRFLQMLSMEQLLPYWWLLPIAVAGKGLYEILQNWAIRTKSFKIITKTRLSQALIGCSTKIILGLFGLKPLGLLIGQIFLQAGGSFSFIKSFRQTFVSNARWLTKSNIRFVAARYAEFPKYRLPSQFLLVVATKAPLLYFAWHFGKEVTGQLGLALTMIALPLTLFGQATSQAYYAEISNMGRRRADEISKLTHSITKKMLCIGLVPGVVLLAAGPLLFSIAFGAQWSEAGLFVRILSPYLVSQFVTSPVTNVLSVIGKQQYLLQINIIRIILALLVFSISYVGQLNAALTLIIYSSIMTLHRVYIYVRIMQLLKRTTPRKP